MTTPMMTFPHACDVTNRLYLFFWENGDTVGEQKCLKVANTFQISIAVFLVKRKEEELN
jgi:hypothetical protein